MDTTTVTARDKAYVCPGSCMAAVPFARSCGDRRCNLFGQPLQEVPVLYCCSNGHCESSHAPAFHQPDCRLREVCLVAKAVVPPSLQLPGNAAAGENSYRDVLDVYQLPIIAPLMYIPGGLPPPSTLPRPAAGSMSVLQVPSGRCEWHGRKMNWWVLEFNDNPTPPGARVFATYPGFRCSIRVNVRTRWRRHHDDYCPGCIVQLYFGMESVFSQGIIERGIHNADVTKRAEFVAPTEPGLYYITQSISLDYQYVNVNHRNGARGAIAVVRVLPTTFENSTFALLPQEWQDQFRMISVLWSRNGLPREQLYPIFSYLMGLNSQQLKLAEP